MKEHPIPQDITGYRFHIIGNMTLKQFAEVAIGCVVALILYKTNLAVVIKWPMIVLAIGLGAGSAFIPIEERPLDHWIFTFIRVMYKPTKYFWRRKPILPAPFTFKPASDAINAEVEIDLSPARRERIKEYMASIQQPSRDKYALDFSEQERIQQILTTFSHLRVAPNRPKTQAEKPNLEVRVRKLGPDSNLKAVARLQYSPAFSISEINEEENEPDAIKPSRTAEQIARQVSLPQNKTIRVEADQVSDEELVLASQQNLNQNQAYVAAAAATKLDPNAAAAATFNAQLPFPVPPKEPNKLVGMVLTAQNELIPNAIVEVKTPNGQIARAVKTNALGQFYITTPLAKGDYVINIEKEGLNFTPQSLQVKDKPIDPLEIHSH